MVGKLMMACCCAPDLVLPLMVLTPAVIVSLKIVGRRFIGKETQVKECLEAGAIGAVIGVTCPVAGAAVVYWCFGWPPMIGVVAGVLAWWLAMAYVVKVIMALPWAMSAKIAAGTILMVIAMIAFAYGAGIVICEYAVRHRW